MANVETVHTVIKKLGLQFNAAKNPKPAVNDVKREFIKDEDDTPQNPDGKIPNTIFDAFPEVEQPVTVSKALESLLTISEDPWLRVMEQVKDVGFNFQELRSETIRFLADMEYLMQFIPEERRRAVMDYWNLNFSPFPGFGDLKELERWFESRGERMLLFLLGQVARFSAEKKNPDSRTI